MFKKFLVILFLIANFAQANELVVPYAPGGAADGFARAVEVFYKKTRTEPLLITYRAGAGGIVGSDFVLKNSMNGNRLVVANSGSFLFPKVFNKQPPYDTDDFFILGPYAHSPSVITTADPKINTLSKLVELSKVKPVSCGVASLAGKVIGTYVLQKAGAKNVEIIMYQGSAPITADMRGRHIDCAIDSLTVQYPQIREGIVTLVAMGSDTVPNEFKNITLYKDVVPNLTFYMWYGIATSNNIPKETKDRLTKIYFGIEKDAEFLQALAKLNLDPATPARDTQQWLNQQITRFDRMRIELGIEKN